LIGYGQCLKQVLWYLNSTRQFYNNCGDALTEKYVRLLSSTREMLERLEQETPGDCLVIPINSGFLYRGYSVLASRWDIEHAQQQWAGPSWLAGHHLLSDPNRFFIGSGLWLDCPGDEYSPYGSSDQFKNFPCFSFDRRVLRFDYRWIGLPSRQSGSLVAFSQE